MVAMVHAAFHYFSRNPDVRYEVRYSYVGTLQRFQRGAGVGIVLKHDSGSAIPKSARAVDRNGRVLQRDYCLLDLEIYLEA